jgi:hypothetical protein
MVEGALESWSSPQNCDDADGNVSPLAAEVAGNGIDDDCDHQIDEAA